MDPARTVTDAERRARLARRHRLAPSCRAADALEAAASLVCLHGTDPATIQLSAWARVEGYEAAQVERALHDERTLVKHLAMRRTLFVFPRAILPAAQAGASERVAARERASLVKAVERAGLHADGAAWLDAACAAVLDALGGGREASSTELRREIPLLEGSYAYGEGRSWGGQVPVGPRVLTVLSAEGRLVRAVNDGPWTSSRPRWARMDGWLGAPIARLTPAEGLAQLCAAWLRAFGPGTEADLKWWTGSTLTAVRGALAELHAVPVALESGRTGWLLSDDLDPVEPVAPWAALLPPLDPTTMGWFEREWYLGAHKPLLFDSTGNGGAAMWWDGRIVGGWRQDEEGAVVLQPLEDCGDEARAAFDAEAERLTAWLDGTRVLPRFPSPLSKLVAGDPARELTPAARTAARRRAR